MIEIDLLVTLNDYSKCTAAAKSEREVSSFKEGNLHLKGTFGAVICVDSYAVSPVPC